MGGMSHNFSVVVGRGQTSFTTEKLCTTWGLSGRAGWSERRPAKRQPQSPVERAWSADPQIQVLGQPHGMAQANGTGLQASSPCRRGSVEP